MSRRALLALGGSSSVVTPPVDPPDEPDPGTPGSDGYPVTTDPILLALRPTGMRVLATGTATLGGYVYDDLAPLIDLSDALHPAPYGRIGPDWSTTLRLPAGGYEGAFNTSRWHNLIGQGATPADVVIETNAINADGVIHPYGPIYIENLTLRATYNPEEVSAPKYCAHIAGSARFTFAHVVFDASDSSGGAVAAGTIGLDGNPGMVGTFYQCDFISQEGNDGYGMNIHGGAPPDIPGRISFVDCNMPNGIEYSGGVVGTVPDEIYVIGGNVPRIRVAGNVVVYTDLDCPVTGAVEVHRDHTDWPLPETGDHGLIDLWANHYYPSALTAPGTTEIKAAVTDAAPMTPVAGRMYYCPIPISSTIHLNRFGINVISGAGAVWGWSPDPDPNVYYGSEIPRGYPDGVLPPYGATLANGKMMSNYYDRTYVIYPATPFGGNRVWFNFRVQTSAGVSITGSAQLPGLHDCYYSDDNGETLIKAPAGTPFPLAHAAQVR